MKIWFKTGLFCLSLATVGYAGKLDIAKSQIQNGLERQFGQIQDSPVSSGILYDISLPLSNPGEMSGDASSAIIEHRRWRQAVYELKNASLIPSALPDNNSLMEITRTAAKSDVHPLLILDYRFHRITPNTSRETVFEQDAGGNLRIKESAIEEGNIFALSVASDKTYHGQNTTFRIDLSEYYYSNQENSLIELRVDFDDGMGFRSIESPSDVVVNYPSTGEKILRVEAEYPNGLLRIGRSRFDVRSLDAPPPTETWPLTASQSYLGSAATGDAYIMFAPGHTELTNPIVVTDGFDIGNTMFWDELYDLLNQQNLIEDALALGFDAVVLNYGDGTTYIQRNAFLVETLLDTIEQVIDQDQTYVIIGPSMGGQITRLALANLENNGIPHRVRTWISFDSPHRGAVIPLGMQYWVDFFSDLSADAALLRDALNSPAARQMLAVHYTTPPSANPASDPLRQTLLNDLQTAGGYPALPRLVAVANGSGWMQGMTFGAGAQIIDYEYDSFLVDIRGNIWALPGAGNQQIFQGEINLIWPLPDEFQNASVNATSPWDNAPGGTSNSMEQMDNVPAPYGDIIALHDNHCFIPTASSLDLNTANLFHDIAGDPNLYSLTPFDTLYFPAANQEHVEITAESYAWFMNEILDSLLAPEVVITEDQTNIRLSWPPVPRAQSYRIYSTTDNTVWPVNYTVTPDTQWIEAAADSMRFYRIIATTANE